MKTKNKIVSLFAVLGMIVSLAGFSGVALADNDDHEREAKQFGSTLEVHVTDKGKVLVRGAKVTAIAGNSITAVTAWGSYSITWNVVATNAHLVRRLGSLSNISEIKVGDFISFQGQVDATVSSPATVNATVIKNWSNQKINSTFSGTVKSIDAANSRFVLSTSKAEITVQVNSSTEIKKGDSTGTFSDIQIGLRIAEVRGAYDANTKTLTAERLKIQSNTSLQKRIFEGTVKSVAALSVPTTMVVTIDGRDYTVTIASDTSILNNNWLRASLSNFAVGNRIRLYGAIQAQSQTTIDATVVRNTSI